MYQARQRLVDAIPMATEVDWVESADLSSNDKAIMVTKLRQSSLRDVPAFNQVVGLAMGSRATLVWEDILISVFDGYYQRPVVLQPHDVLHHSHGRCSTEEASED